MKVGMKTSRVRKADDFRPLSIVHLVSTLNIGGLERVVYDLVRCSDRRRFEMRVLCLGAIGALGPLFNEIGIPVESLDVSSAGLLRSVNSLIPRLRELKPDVLHTHNPTPHLVGAVAAKISGVPVVVHTKHGRNYPKFKRRVLANRLASWLTDCVVPVSENAADVVRDVERVPGHKVEMIWNGIDLDRYRYRGQDHSPNFRAIHVARLKHPEKDQETLLRAARIVADAEPRFQLDIVGDGEHREPLEALCDELRLRQHVNFLGFRDDIHALLSAADLFVLSSITEGLSLTLLEAMATGLPIVATRIGGNPEVIVDDETGILVPAESPDSMAQAMLALLRDPARAAAMGFAGRRRIEDHFDLRFVSARYERLYARLSAAAGTRQISKLNRRPALAPLDRPHW